MSCRKIHLADDDQKLYDRVHDNLEVCASYLTLSKKLLNRFSISSGSAIAILPDWVPFDTLVDYSQGSIPPPGLKYGEGERPSDELAVFVEEFLETSKDNVVLCENSDRAHKVLEIWTWSRPPRFSNYGNDEVYYILTRPEDGRDTIGDTLGDTLGHWGTAVCSSCAQIPEGEITDESFFDEVVRNTKHILMSAFDGDGFLIWRPA